MYAPDHARPRLMARPRPHQRGISLIELMVGMVVCMLVGLAAAGSAAMFTASQRQGIGVGGAMVNANTALNAIRDDAASVGLGFFGDSKYLCSKLNLSIDNTMVVDGASFTPVKITTETAGDRIDLVYASQVASGANVLLNGTSAGASAKLRSLLPVATEQAVLLAPITPGDPCVVRSVTAITDSTVDTPQELTFDNTGTHNKKAFTTAVTYPDKGRIALLGDVRWMRYHLVGTELRLERPLITNSTAVVLARNVVAFRAEYGISAVGGTSLSAWQPATGTDFADLTPAALTQVRALRIGLVTRSPQAEKPGPSGCEATPVKPKDPLDPTHEITTDVSNWQCYRYRTSVVVVPLRNLVMGVGP